jgi:hypothetical protein
MKPTTAIQCLQPSTMFVDRWDARGGGDSMR